MPDTNQAQPPQSAPDPDKGGSYVRHPETLQLTQVEATKPADPKLRSEAADPTDQEA